MSLQPQTMTWQETAARMQAIRDDTIAAVDPPVPEVPTNLPQNVTGLHAQLLPPEVLSITQSPPEVLLAQLADGRLTSTEVTRAFLQRAGLAAKLTNCITELLPDRALRRANYLDKYFAQHRKPIGPLHGLPISVKENLSMRGRDLNAGFVAWVGTVPAVSHTLLHHLWTAGAVFHVRTTEPQTLMHLETSSNIYGVTTNPFNTALTSGGSSGGEGSLLGQGGSCLGIGSDIGGSIRSPAANNGVFGLKPTTNRLPVTGSAAAMLGAEHIVPVIGPLSTSLEGLRIFAKAVIDQRPWIREPASNLPIPWKEPGTSPTGSLLRVDATTGRRRLRIGYMRDDGVVRPHPPILRGMQTLITALSNHPDIELVPFPPFAHAEAWRITSQLYYADGGAEERAALAASGEPLRPLTEWSMGQPGVRDQGVAGVWRLTMERERYRALYAQHWRSVGTSFLGPSEEILEADPTLPFAGGMGGLQNPSSPFAADEGEANLDDRPFESAEAIEEAAVDVLLCPVGPGCAPPLDCARYWGYTAQWNLLDYPCLVFPTGLKCEARDVVEEGYVPRNEQDEYNYNLYSSPEVYQDAPISLQLIGKRYEDEKLIEALEMILDAAGLPRTVGFESGVRQS